MHKVVIALLGAAAVVAAYGTAHATTIPFNYTIINTHTPADTDPAHYFMSNVDLNTGEPGAGKQRSDRLNGPGDNAGSVGGSAYADLQNGQLKARSFSDDPQGQYFYNQQNAIFGDGFRALTPDGPFQWTPGSSGRFDITLDGTVTASPDITTMGVGGFIILAIYQPGTLDPNKNLIGGPNMINYYLWLVGNPNLQSLLLRFPRQLRGADAE